MTTPAHDWRPLRVAGGFRNPDGPTGHPIRNVLRWRWRRWRTGVRPVWPRWVERPPGPRPPERVPADALRVGIVGHASVLLQLSGSNLLVDPHWSRRASPVPWAGPARVCAPGIRWEDLPPIDAVLLTHDHFDHFDAPTLRRLARRDDPRAFAGQGLRPLLRRLGFSRVVELDWWDRVRVGDVDATFVPARHWSNRGRPNRTLWGGFHLRAGGRSIYHAGDTAWFEGFAAIRERLGPPELALLPIGAFEPRWFMGRVHLAPDEALRAHAALGARRSIATHHDVFPLADESWGEAWSQLEAAGRDAGIEPGTFAAGHPGETYD